MLTVIYGKRLLLISKNNFVLERMRLKIGIALRTGQPQLKNLLVLTSKTTVVTVFYYFAVLIVCIFEVHYIWLFPLLFNSLYPNYYKCVLRSLRAKYIFKMYLRTNILQNIKYEMTAFAWSITKDLGQRIEKMIEGFLKISVFFVLGQPI